MLTNTTSMHRHVVTVRGQRLPAVATRLLLMSKMSIFVIQVLPMLASALEFGGAPAVALGALLQIGKSLDEDNFATQVVPALSKLFASNDRTIRRSLLESIDSYGSHFTQVIQCGDGKVLWQR